MENDALRAPAFDRRVGEGRGKDQPRDRGWAIFWKAWDRLGGLGLIALVGHLIEADNSTANVIRPYAVRDSGEAAERRLADAAHEAGVAI